VIRLLLASALACAALTGCGAGPHDAAGTPFHPATPGELTVATAFLPAPGFWQGTPPTSGGFEARLAAALARELGLNAVKVIQVPFAQIVTGHLRGADVAISQLTPTKKRQDVLEFTTPYLMSPPGVLTLKTIDAPDVASLQQLRWVSSTTSSLTPILDSQVRPVDPPVVTEDRTAALEVLRSGSAEALLLDLPVALGLAESDPMRLHVVGQLTGGEGLAVALPKGSSNEQIVDSAIRHLQTDGVIDRLVSRWFGEHEDDVPLIRTEG
jgi:polar amino acid transport system substrate-binding protein